ncbi:hypothetical protein BDV93DRAFT_512065 [Ceratobasidium sp. AG-I]|nr:hypothetical protein BDV93DRAFT_512065 [Ceratobasidium sp. AG-I]
MAPQRKTAPNYRGSTYCGYARAPARQSAISLLSVAWCSYIVSPVYCAQIRLCPMIITNILKKKLDRQSAELETVTLLSNSEKVREATSGFNETKKRAQGQVRQKEEWQVEEL